MHIAVPLSSKQSPLPLLECLLDLLVAYDVGSQQALFPKATLNCTSTWTLFVFLVLFAPYSVFSEAINVLAVTEPIATLDIQEISPEKALDMGEVLGLPMTGTMMIRE